MALMQSGMVTWCEAVMLSELGHLTQGGQCRAVCSLVRGSHAERVGSLDARRPMPSGTFTWCEAVMLSGMVTWCEAVLLSELGHLTQGGQY
ncbi:hypothetical protein [Paenibacillus sp. P36]|uniref:hypothetical protein n=1 Tax=Paenibacillus sp. P36 TaxID=3342538 RepID=UPI0038B3C0CF